MRSGFKSGLLGLLTGAMLLGGCGKNESAESASRNATGASATMSRGGSETTGRLEKSETILCPNYWDLAATESFMGYFHRDQKSLLQPNVFIKDFPGRIVYFDKRQGDMLYGLRINDETNERFKELVAESAEIKDEDDGTILLDMHNIRVSLAPSGIMTAERMQHSLPNLNLNHSSVRPEGSVKFMIFGQEYFARFLSNNKSRAGQNNEFNTSICIGYNSRQLASSDINLDASRMYLISSCPLNGIRRAKHIARLVFSGNEASLVPETIPGEGLSEADSKTSERILSMAIDSSPIKKLIGGAKVYCVADGANLLHRSEMSETNTGNGLRTEWDGLSYSGDFNYDENAMRAGVVFAVVADLEFRSQSSNETTRRNIVSFVNYAPPFFKEIKGYWDIPSEGRIFGFDDGWIFKADTPFIYDNRNRVVHYATTAILGRGRQIFLDGLGKKESIEIVGDKTPSIIYYHGDKKETLVRSTKYNKE